MRLNWIEFDFFVFFCLDYSTMVSCAVGMSLSMSWLCVAGRERLSEILGMSTEQASQFQDSFLQKYKELHAFIKRTIQLCHEQGLCVLHCPAWG